jgi:hypothetical protein
MLKMMMAVLTQTVPGIKEPAFHLPKCASSLILLFLSVLKIFLTLQIVFLSLFLRTLKIDMEAEVSASDSGLPIVTFYGGM